MSNITEIKTFIKPHGMVDIPGLKLERGWGNGYIVLPPTHPCHGINYNEIYNKYPERDFLQELTFSDNIDAAYWEVDPKIVSTKDWVVGWDTAHWGDTPSRWPEEKVRERTLEMAHVFWEIWVLHERLKNKMVKTKAKINKVQTVILPVLERNWHSSRVSRKNREFYVAGERDRYKEFINKRISTLQGSEKIFFEGNFTLPRTKFYSEFPKVKMVSDVKDADVIMIRDLSYVRGDVQESSLVPEVEDGDEYWGWYKVADAKGAESWTNECDIYESPKYTVLEKSNMDEVHRSKYSIPEIDDMDKYYKMLEDKKILLLKDIRFAGGVEFNEEIYNKVSQMMQSEDIEMNKLGMKLLCGTNYMAVIPELAALFSSAEKLRYASKLTKGVEMKFIQDMVQDQFPAYRVDEDQRLEEFWIPIAAGNNKNPIIQKAFNKFANERLQDYGEGMEGKTIEITVRYK